MFPRNHEYGSKGISFSMECFPPSIRIQPSPVGAVKIEAWLLNLLVFATENQWWSKMIHLLLGQSWPYFQRKTHSFRECNNNHWWGFLEHLLKRHKNSNRKHISGNPWRRFPLTSNHHHMFEKNVKEPAGWSLDTFCPVGHLLGFSYNQNEHSLYKENSTNCWGWHCQKIMQRHMFVCCNWCNYVSGAEIFMIPNVFMKWA